MISSNFVKAFFLSSLCHSALGIFIFTFTIKNFTQEPLIVFFGSILLQEEVKGIDFKTPLLKSNMHYQPSVREPITDMKQGQRAVVDIQKPSFFSKTLFKRAEPTKVNFLPKTVTPSPTSEKQNLKIELQTPPRIQLKLPSP